MFIKTLLKKNQALLDVALRLHQEGAIEPNTWIIDLDAIAKNARAIGTEADRLGLTTYFMTKQISRNPLAVALALHQGIHKTVAVDIQCATALNRYGIPIGHIGHLSQVPLSAYPRVLDMKPDYITVYSLETARALSEAAINKQCVQDILIKVVDHGDLFFPGQESGIFLDHLVDFVKAAQGLAGIRLAGLTAFPCLTYNINPGDAIGPTPNFKTLIKAKRHLEAELGLVLDVVNAPGNTAHLALEVLKTHGATHVEPGHGLTGTTPVHRYTDKAPEIPALVYVSEISHHFKDQAYAFGGGLYVCLGGGPKDEAITALVGKTPQALKENPLKWQPLDYANIDYYGIVTPGAKAQVGDTVLMGFRPQTFVTRANIAAVSGIHSSNPVLEGIFDPMGHLLDQNQNPLPIDQVKERIAVLLSKYPTL